MAYLPINFQISQIFRTSFNINILTEKKYFCHGFSFFLMNYLKLPPQTPKQPYNNQNPVVTKKFFGNALLAMTMKCQPFSKKYTL